MNLIQFLPASKCIESALRVLINLTHDDSLWSQAVLEDVLALPVIMRLVVTAQRQRQMLEKRVDTDEADADDAETAAHCLDRMCLALGLLTNLVQATPDAKHALGSTCKCNQLIIYSDGVVLTSCTVLDSHCPAQRRCLRECTCPTRASALACLAEVYMHYLKSSSELDAVIRGHMAVLFGLLMEHAPANQHALLAAIPGEDSWTKLGTLLQHAQDFTSFYVSLTRKMAEAHTREDAKQDEDEDVSAPTSASGRAFRDSKGEAVAKGVIAYLKRLRDET